MNNQLRQLYQQFRRSYFGPTWETRTPAWGALRAARERLFVDQHWPDLEAAGKVRLRIEPDADWSWDWLEGDAFNVELNADSVHGGARTILAQQKRFREQVERDGVWGWIVEVRCPCCGQWEVSDSCWGFTDDYIHEAALEGQATAIHKVLGI